MNPNIPPITVPKKIPEGQLEVGPGRISQKTYERARQGDPNAMVQVFGTLGESLTRYFVYTSDLRRARETSDEPCDWAQVGLLGSLFYFLRIRGEPPKTFFGLKNLALTIARNAFTDERRKENYHNAHQAVDDYPKDNYPPNLSLALGSEEFEDELLARLTAEQIAPVLQDAFSGLTEPQQQVVELRILRGLSTKEAADALNMSEGAVKASLHRALQSLRRELKNQPEFDFNT